ncbi:MAG: methyltransferase domain-containing protein [Alphaproteobacteria bacterium]
MLSNDYKLAGRMPTLNRMGWMHPIIDICTERFLHVAAKTNDPVIEIGASYGYASWEALKSGACVWVNDLEEKHLNIFYSYLPTNLQRKTTLLVGDFPDTIRLPHNYFKALLSIRVFHFYSPEKLIKTAQEIYNLLMKDGLTFIVCESPYLANWKNFIPIYEKHRSNGDLFPGLVDSPELYNPENLKHLPSTIHFMDPEVLSRVFKQVGFEILESTFFERRDFPKSMQYDGRESVLLIAKKP